MLRMTRSQREGLADFFNMVAVAWLAGGVITPWLLFLVGGITLAVASLRIAFILWQQLDYVQS